MPRSLSYEKFEASLENLRPPDGLSLPLQALWYAGKNDWYKAHELADAQEEGGGAWVHAYLHRWEGDEWNAKYWYNRAQKQVFNGSLKAEWTQISKSLLGDS
ncbi:MAG: hypothetical protein AAFR61_19180 [Bacteroidota bacterium]